MISKYLLFFKAPFMLMGLLHNQWLKPAGLRELQDKKLRALIEHSYKNVPYYHSLLKKAKITPNDIKTVDDLRKIPISRKENIRELTLREITAKNADLNRCWISRTSGTTGIPVSVPWDPKTTTIHILTHIRFMMACGNKITNRIVEIGISEWLPTNHLIQRIGIYKTKNISPFEHLEKQIEEIRKFKPNALFGNPSCIRLVAAETRERGVQEIEPSLVFTGGEMLDEYTRKLHKDVFGAETFDHYGCNEAGDISYECDKREGYHILSDSILVEITKDNDVVSAGEKGEVTVTNLYNYAGPIIRYNLEDIGFLLEDDCTCGRSFPLMKITGGRKSDAIQLPDGRVISTITVTDTLNPISGLKQFKVIQEKKDLFLVKVVKGRRFSDRTVEEIKQRLRDGLGDVEVDVLVVDEIPRDKSGKFKWFTTRVKYKGLA